MSLCQSCSNNCVPLLARIVLGAAFITAGWGKFQSAPFSGDQLQTLQDMGLASVSNDEATIISASLSYQDSEDAEVEGQDADTESQDEEVASAEGSQDAGGAGDDEEVVEQPETGSDATAGDSSVQMKQLYGIATMLRGTPAERYAKYLAWGAACTELAGGILILIGLFSRLWGLGLAIVMATAFYLTSLGPLSDANYKLFNLDMGDYQQMFLQLSLFVLAFGVFITGPGALSVDRLIFKGGNRDGDADIDLT